MIFKDFNENGFVPSGGIGQRLVIARASYKDSRIVILDEPTASLDPLSERNIYETSSKLLKGRTQIFISHRMALTKKSDKILVLSKGKIIERGTHESLLNNDSLYRKLYMSQKELY